VSVRFYFLVKFQSPESDYSLLVGRCLSQLHGFRLHHQQRAGIGICLPAWSDASIGNVVGFVCKDKDLLCFFRRRSYFELMASEGYFEISPILEVPCDLPDVRFIRNQCIAKAFAGERRRRLARAKRRVEARGGVFAPLPPVETREIAGFHCALMYSQCSNQGFVFFLQLVPCECEGSDRYTTYGLATSTRFDGSVPLLSPYY